MQFIENVNKEEYQEFTNNHEKSHFLQSYEWGEFSIKGKHLIPKYLGIKDEDNKLVATILLLIKKTPFGYSYAYAPRGFILDFKNYELIKEFTNHLKKYMHDNKIIYIKIDPDIKYQDIDEAGNAIENGFNNKKLYNYMLSLGYIHKGFNKLYEGNQPRYTFRINLKRPFEEVENTFSSSFKKSIKRSYNYDIVINNNGDIKTFCELNKFNSNKDNFNAYGEDYFKEFYDKFKESNNVKFFNAVIKPKELVKKFKDELNELTKTLETVKKRKADIEEGIKRLNKDIETFSLINQDEVCVCSLICVYTNNRCWSLYIGSNELANLTFAVTRCYYESIKDAHSNNYDFYDLFGTTGDPKTTYKNLAHLHDFKRKFGDEYIEFIGEFDLVNNKLLYKILPTLLKVYRKIRK
ncbi:MAG: peptidoglycan bridge formation glycyltransferase FemA/FemB family protein [Bacilli bacterium]